MLLKAILFCQKKKKKKKKKKAQMFGGEIFFCAAVTLIPYFKISLYSSAPFFQNISQTARQN